MASLLFPTLPKEASDFLLALASGKYTTQLAEFDRLLATVGAAVPQALVAKQLLDGLVDLNKVTAPLQVEPDGQGGFVPTTNSHYDPATGQFL
jgi:hypothetical protein